MRLGGAAAAAVSAAPSGARQRTCIGKTEAQLHCSRSAIVLRGATVSRGETRGEATVPGGANGKVRPRLLCASLWDDDGDDESDEKRTQRTGKGHVGDAAPRTVVGVVQHARVGCAAPAVSRRICGVRRESAPALCESNGL